MACDEVEIYARKRGVTLDLLVRFKTNGNATNLTGTTNHLMLMHNERSGVATASANGAIEGDAANGEVTYDMSAAGGPSEQAAGKWFVEFHWDEAGGGKAISKTIEWDQEASLEPPSP